MVYITREDDIDILKFSVRTCNGLRRSGLHTVGALLDYPADKFIHIRNLGTKSVDEIQQVLLALVEGSDNYMLVEAYEQIKDNTPMIVEALADDSSTAILIDEHCSIVRDITINSLPLSIRTKNVLIRGGYKHISQLIGLTFEELMLIRNMGRKSAEEVLSCVAQISVREDSCSFSGDLATEMHAAYGARKGTWLREIFTVKALFPEAMGETLIFRLYDSVFVRDAAKARILQIIEENNDEVSRTFLKDNLPQHLNNTTILKEILLELEAISAIEVGEVMIRRQYLSVAEFTAQITNERIREILHERLAGKTLNEIGERYGISRERVRQIVSKALHGRPRLREDKYANIYEHYDFSCEDFMLAFEEPKETYYYLDMFCPVAKHKKKRLDGILTDITIPPEYREKVKRTVYQKHRQRITDSPTIDIQEEADCNKSKPES